MQFSSKEISWTWLVPEGATIRDPAGDPVMEILGLPGEVSQFAELDVSFEDSEATTTYRIVFVAGDDQEAQAAKIFDCLSKAFPDHSILVVGNRHERANGAVRFSVHQARAFDIQEAAAAVAMVDWNGTLYEETRYLIEHAGANYRYLISYEPKIWYATVVGTDWR